MSSASHGCTQSAASVARRYYIDGLSKTEIADEYRLSRFKIARLLETARSQGLVRIEISHPGTIDVELAPKRIYHSELRIS